MRKLVALVAFVAISAAASALAYQTLHDDQNLNGFKLYGGAAPDRSTGGLRVHDISVGTGLLKINGVDSLSYTVAEPGADYLAPIGTSAGNYDRVSVAASGLVTGGATMVAANVTALEALSGANYRDGSRVFVQSVASDFVFFTSNATTVDHKMIASVSGMAGARWIRDPEASGAQFNQVSWFINTATGSDEFDCVTSGTACATFAEVRRRILNRYVPIGNTQSITITIAGNLGDQDPIAVDMLLVARNLATTVTVMGTPTTASLGTVASVTAHNYASNQVDQVTITALDWTPYIGKIVRRVGTSGTTGQTSLVVATCGTGCAQMTQVSVFGGPGTAWQAGDSVEALTLPKAQGVRAGFAGTLLVGNFDFDPTTTSAVVSVLGPGNAIIFASTFKGSSGGQFTDRGGGIALGGCGFSTRTFLAAGNVSVNWSLLSSVPTFTLNNSRVGRNEWQDAVLLNSTIALGEYVHVRFHSLGVYSLAAAAAAITMQDGASTAFTDVIYGTGNSGTSKAFTFLSDNHVYFSLATNIPADVGNAATIPGASVTIAKTDMPYYRDVWGNEIQIAQNVDPTKHLAVAGGDITYVVGAPSQVTAIHETSGPTQLPIGAISSGQFLQDVGGTIVGVSVSGFVPTTRTVQGTAPIQIAGDNVAHDLSVNRVWSFAYDNASLEVFGGGLRRAALTGDVTAAAGSNATTLANIPNDTPMAGDLLATAIAAPSTPASGKGRIYVDSTSKNVAVKDDAGVVKHGVQTAAAVSHQFVTAISDAGAVSLAQPSYTDLSGSVPAITSLTGDGTASGPGAAPFTLASVGGGLGSCTYCSVTFDAKGRQTAYSSGATPEVPLTFSNGARRTVNNVAVDLTTGVAGGQSVVGGTAASNNLTLSSTTNGTKGKILFGTSAYDEANNRLGVALASPLYAMDVSSGLSNISGFHVSPGGSDNGAYLLTTTANQAILSGGSAFNGGSWIAKSTSASIVSQDSGSIVFYGDTGLTAGVGYTPTQRLAVGPSGVDAAALSAANGIVTNAVTTGRLGTQAWPGAGGFLVVNATNDGLQAGISHFRYDGSTDIIEMDDDITQAWYNTGALSATYERVHEFWSSNVWNLKSEKGGIGTTVRDMKIDPGTATLTLAGAVSIPTALKFTTSTTVGHVLMAVSTSGDVGYQPQTQITHAGSLENAFDGFATAVAANPGVTDNVLAISNSGSNDTIFERAANTIDVMRQFNYFVFGIEPVNWLITSTPSTTSATAIEYDSYGGTVQARVIANVTNNTLAGCTSKTYAVTHNGTSSAASVTIGCGVTVKSDSGWVAVTAGSTDSWGLKVTTSGVTTSGTVSASFTVLVR